MTDLLTPKQAATELGISTATITRCVKRGAPVHRWGSTGTRYRVRISELVAWMDQQGAERNANVVPISAAHSRYDMEEMARLRRELVRTTR